MVFFGEHILRGGRDRERDTHTHTHRERERERERDEVSRILLV